MMLHVIVTKAALRQNHNIIINGILLKFNVYSISLAYIDIQPLFLLRCEICKILIVKFTAMF